MNIQSIADLLQEFVKAEVDILNSQDIKHPTTIGTMYEGLTAAILNQAIFTNLDLRVVKNSFIIGCDTEFDVMLVIGLGEQIPYSDRYKYAPDKVIAIVQVKKNLYAKGIAEGYENLKYIIDYIEPEHLKPFMIRLFRDSFRAICRKDITAYKAGSLDEYEEAIYHTLKVEAGLPVRIVWGYNGFASELSFRDSFNNYLLENVTTDLENIKGGFGPHNFPSLIICESYSMNKNNGMPFGGKILENNWWPFYTSSSYNPTYYFLEAIWTRLSYMFEGLPSEIFGDDLTLEPLNRFLDCRIKEWDGKRGWEYNYFVMSDEILKEHIASKEWEPTQIDSIQYTVITQIGKQGEIDIVEDNLLEEFVKTGGYISLSDFLDKLTNTGLAYLENNKLRLLTDDCHTVFTPDGKSWAAENKSGRLTNWALKKYADKMKK